jgi:threonine/homoserine/homoserine lactone efflux protein
VFLVSAVALLGSPGPGIAALLAVGRAEGLVIGLRYFLGLQVGLAVAAGASALGLLSFLQVFPAALRVMTIVAAGYLAYLAYRIATAPVGATAHRGRISSSAASGAVLGVTNPKAYVAFASLFASQRLVIADSRADLQLKWCLCAALTLH